MVWLVFLGGAIVSWRNLHLRMDVISAKARGAAATLRDVFEGILSLAVCGVMSGDVLGITEFRFADP